MIAAHVSDVRYQSAAVVVILAPASGPKTHVVEAAKHVEVVETVEVVAVSSFFVASTVVAVNVIACVRSALHVRNCAFAIAIATALVRNAHRVQIYAIVIANVIRVRIYATASVVRKSRVVQMYAITV